MEYKKSKLFVLTFTALMSGMLFAAPAQAMLNQAVANVMPTAGNQVKGQVTFTPVKNGVKIVADFTGLTPGLHGFHVHEKGDCSAPDAQSAGGHYNPTHLPHGAPQAKQRHEGDLGNVMADAKGQAHYERIDAVIQLSGPDSIVGRSVIVHASTDDLHSQPAGNSGARVACGVIEEAGN
ncbi:MAG: superoxide dismutase family protein [Gammaproteobacteria bacterium]